MLKRLFELVRYAMTGALSVALNIIVVEFLTEWVGLHYLVSISLCFVTVTFVSFCLNRLWTFRRRGAGAHSELGRYVLLTLTMLPVSLLGCSICVGRLHMTYIVALVVTSVLFTPMTYALHRSWSFQLRWSESGAARDHDGGTLTRFRAS